MALVKWHPFRKVTNFQDELNNLFDDFFKVAAVDKQAEGADFAPAVDVSEDKDNFYVKAEVPGVDQKDIDVSYEDGLLTIKGEKKSEEETKEKNYYRRETYCGSFLRTIPFAGAVDDAKIKAAYKNGTLSVTLPKKEEVKSKKISVNVD